MALFYIFLFYDRQANLLFSTLILGSFFRDYAVFYAGISSADRQRYPTKHNVICQITSFKLALRRQYPQNHVLFDWLLFDISIVFVYDEVHSINVVTAN